MGIDANNALEGLTKEETDILLGSSELPYKEYDDYTCGISYDLWRVFMANNTREPIEILWQLIEKCQGSGFQGLATELKEIQRKKPTLEIINRWLQGVDAQERINQGLLRTSKKVEADVRKLCAQFGSPEFAPFDVRVGVMRGYLTRETPPPEAIQLGVHLEIMEIVERDRYEPGQNIVRILGTDINEFEEMIQEIIERDPSMPRVTPPDQRATESSIKTAAESVLYKLEKQRDSTLIELGQLDYELRYRIVSSQTERRRIKEMKKDALERFLAEVEAEIQYCQTIINSLSQ